MKLAVITVSNDLVTDQRVLRLASVLAGEYRVMLAGRELPGSLPTDTIPFETTRYRMLFRRKMLFYKFLNIRHLFLLLRLKPDLVVSVDLDTLPAGVAASVLLRRPLLYDAHEYFTGTPDLAKKPLRRWFWKLTERICFSRVHNIITVNESIASLYRSEYGVEPVVIRNISPLVQSEKHDRGELGIPDGAFVMVIHGTGINPGRGGMEAVRAAELLRSSKEYSGLFHLLVIGRGDEVPAMKEYVAANALYDEVTFLAPMPWSDLHAYLSMADAGLCLDAGDTPNSLYSLPNKLFDYLHNGLAVISTRLPEIERTAGTSRAVHYILNNSPEAIANAAAELSSDPAGLTAMKAQSKELSMQYSWERERAALEAVVAGLAANK